MYRRKKDIEEFNEMYGPFCWHGYDNDPGGFKKLMWCGIMKHFNGKANIYMVQVRACKRNGLYAQTTWRQEARMEIAVGLNHWAQWDHCPIYARIQEGKKEVDWMEAQRQKHNILNSGKK